MYFLLRIVSTSTFKIFTFSIARSFCPLIRVTYSAFEACILFIYIFLIGVSFFSIVGTRSRH